MRHYFSSNNVHLLAYVFTGEDSQSEWLKRVVSNRAYWPDYSLAPLGGLSDLLLRKQDLPYKMCSGLLKSLFLLVVPKKKPNIYIVKQEIGVTYNLPHTYSERNEYYNFYNEDITSYKVLST